jgi:hypothetical protein
LFLNNGWGEGSGYIYDCNYTYGDGLRYGVGDGDGFGVGDSCIHADEDGEYCELQKEAS